MIMPKAPSFQGQENELRTTARAGRPPLAMPEATGAIGVKTRGPSPARGARDPQRQRAMTQALKES